MLVMLAAVVIAILLGIAYISGFFKKKPGEKFSGENVPEEGTRA